VSVSALAGLMKGRRVMVLSGAGVSTESGIPDYRGPSSAARRARPVLYRQFVSDPRARARYWMRSAIGWPRVAAAQPNAGHRALARLEMSQVVGGVITQNVDSV
jgi:NAD-dependent deacetylase sirtuin 4